VVPGLAGWRKAEEKYRREGKEWRSIRKDVETMHKKRKWLEKIAKEEAKKVFSAKPYDPHKTERGRGTYKNYE
jgi:superfamily I DNA and/or RNA helicase